MKTKIPPVLVDGATVVASLCVLVVTVTMLLRGPQRSLLAAAEPRPIENWEAIAEAGHRIGPEDALLTIIEFGDYQCPVCRSFQSTVEAMLETYPDEVAVVYRHWPLTAIHRYAYDAARAAECAASQGRFEAYHRQLYADDYWLGDAFVTFAEAAGVPDLDAFRRCIASDEPVPAIEASIELAKAIEARGTPALVVNGVLLGRTPTLEDLEDRLRAALREVAASG